MKHLEASKKIVTEALVDPVSVKYSLVQRLRSAFHVETVGEGVESFSVSAASKTGAYAFTAGVSLKSEKTRIRILLEGQNNLRMGTRIFYVLSLLMVLILSLFPEAVDGARGGGGMAMNAMFFLVIGGFIIYDHSKKMDEPQAILDQILNSLEAEFG
jgi:hypothetical protein